MSELLDPASERVLAEKGYRYTTQLDGGLICLVIANFGLPEGYEPRAVDLLLRLPLQFPNVAPDMFWMDPPARYTGGLVPQATELMEVHLGRQWQRWSRHFGPAQWRIGTDDLRSYLQLIRTTINREVAARAA